MLPAHRADGARILHRNRLPATGVVGDRQHYQRNALAAYAGNQLFEGVYIHVALEGLAQARLLGLRTGQVDGFGTDELDVRARSVEMRIVRDHVALLAGAR